MTTHILRRALLSIAIAACDMSALPAPAHAADGVTRWSEFAIRSNEDGKTGTVSCSCTLAGKGDRPGWRCGLPEFAAC